MVHLTVAVVPATTPVTVVVGEDAVVMVAVPATNVQTPVPTDGALWVIVNDPLLHLVWFG